MNAWIERHPYYSQVLYLICHSRTHIQHRIPNQHNFPKSLFGQFFWSISMIIQSHPSRSMRPIRSQSALPNPTFRASRLHTKFQISNCPFVSRFPPSVASHMRQILILVNILFKPFIANHNNFDFVPEPHSDTPISQPRNGAWYRDKQFAL